MACSAERKSGALTIRHLPYVLVHMFSVRCGAWRELVYWREEEFCIRVSHPIIYTTFCPAGTLISTTVRSVSIAGGGPLAIRLSLLSPRPTPSWTPTQPDRDPSASPFLLRHRPVVKNPATSSSCQESSTFVGVEVASARRNEGMFNRAQFVLDVCNRCMFTLDRGRQFPIIRIEDVIGNTVRDVSSGPSYHALKDVVPSSKSMDSSWVLVNELAVRTHEQMQTYMSHLCAVFRQPYGIGLLRGVQDSEGPARGGPVVFPAAEREQTWLSET
ncbi:hypothetical protein B0H21DRAFT_525613 [Amylocystis lapponica]|nr:hypothetical protein B0H21DRAFT_525613 [Amylocystis lapponica]